MLGVDPDSKLGVQFAEVMAKVVEAPQKHRGNTRCWRGDGLEDGVRGCEQGGAHLEGC